MQLLFFIVTTAALVMVYFLYRHAEQTSSIIHVKNIKQRTQPPADLYQIRSSKDKEVKKVRLTPEEVESMMRARSDARSIKIFLDQQLEQEVISARRKLQPVATASDFQNFRTPAPSKQGKILVPTASESQSNVVMTRNTASGVIRDGQVNESMLYRSKSGTSKVGEDHGTLKVGNVYGTSKVGEDYGTSKVGEDQGTSKVGEDYGSSKVGEDYGAPKGGENHPASKVGEDYGSSKVGEDQNFEEVKNDNETEMASSQISQAFDTVNNHIKQAQKLVSNLIKIKKQSTAAKGKTFRTVNNLLNQAQQLLSEPAKMKYQTMWKGKETKSNGSEDAVSRRLPRILCWVLTDPDLLKHSMVISETWGPRCDKLLYMSTKSNSTFPTIQLPIDPGRRHIAAKSKLAWTYIYVHHLHDFDYFVKCDGDTFLIVENLKQYLANRDPEVPEYFGHRMNVKRTNLTYNSGGPGQVLSRASVRLLVEKAFVNETNTCWPDGQGEDYKTAKCLSALGARTVDTRDEKGRLTFLIFKLFHHVEVIHAGWYIDRIVDHVPGGTDCCSDYPIGFHYVSPSEMRQIYYWVYRVKFASMVADTTDPLNARELRFYSSSSTTKKYTTKKMNKDDLRWFYSSY